MVGRGRGRWLAAMTAVVVLLVPAAANADPTTPPAAPQTAPPTGTPSATASGTAPGTASPTPSTTPTGGISTTAASFVAELADLQQQATTLQTDLTAQQATSAAALARYDASTRAVQDAVAAAATAQASLTTANAEVESTRKLAQVVARDAYIDAVPHTSSALLLTADPGDLDFTIAALNYLGGRTGVALGRLRDARTVAAGFAARQQDSLAQAQELQKTADADRATALTALGLVQTEQQAFAAEVEALRSKAATAAAATTSPADVAAYQSFLAALTALTGPGAGTGTPGGTTYVAGGPGLTPLPGTSWVRPLVSYRISSCYCVRGTEFHHGVDLAAPLGTPVYAVGAGTVVAAGPANGFGNWVVVDHHDGSFSIYGHEKVLATRVGAVVAPGTLIAYVGSEGESTGPHLHFEVRLGSYANASSSTDPVLWLAQRGVTL